MIDESTMTIILTEADMESVRRHARLAEIGGVSRIRTVDRAATLSGDQLTAQCGEAALSKLLTGTIELYENTRLEREKNPHIGDGGSDLLGMNIDVKTSRMRAGVNYKYNLWIRPREYHPEIYYYLALMPVDADCIVHFVGWVQGEFVPLAGDRYQLRQDELNPMTAGEYEDEN